MRGKRCNFAASKHQRHIWYLEASSININFNNHETSNSTQLYTDGTVPPQYNGQTPAHHPAFVHLLGRGKGTRDNTHRV
jgi:hypothetical protein